MTHPKDKYTADEIASSRLRGLVIIIMVTTVIGLLFVGTADATGDRDDQEQSQEQDQSQSQEQYSTQYNSQGQANEQSSVNTSDTRVYAAGASSGDSSALCQQVRDFRIADGFLFGLRFDLTHQDCLRLQMADGAYSRGQIDFGNSLTCTTKIAREVYQNVNDCKDSLEQTAEVVRLRSEVAKLESQKADLLRERAIEQEQCEDAKDRIAESKACAGK